MTLAREVNDEIADMCRTGEEFIGLASIPLQDDRLAMGELERIGSEPEFFGIMIGANVNGELWDSPRLFPILEAASQMGLYVVIHPDPFMYDRSLSEYHVTEFIAHQAQMTYSAASLIFGGVMDRLPDLKICLCQSGGYVAFAAGRLDQTFTAWRNGQIVQALPSTYLRRFHFDSLTYGPSALRHLIDVVGVDRLLLGTDVPSSVHVDDPVGWIRTCSLTSAEEDAILGLNFEKVLAEGRPVTTEHHGGQRA
jgi:aminocarboxymuconate-semialdehyde decarboxylase